MAQFVKGQKGGPGRPKGSLNPLTRTVKEAFQAVFDSLQGDPKANLLEWGKANPTKFYELASKLIPADHSVTVKKDVRDYSTEELIEQLQAAGVVKPSEGEAIPAGLH